MQGDGVPFSVAETAIEVVGRVDDNPDGWVSLTLAGTDDGLYDGKPIQVRAARVVAVGPPMRDPDAA